MNPYDEIWKEIRKSRSCLRTCFESRRRKCTLQTIITAEIRSFSNQSLQRIPDTASHQFKPIQNCALSRCKQRRPTVTKDHKCDFHSENTSRPVAPPPVNNSPLNAMIIAALTLFATFPRMNLGAVNMWNSCFQVKTELLSLVYTLCFPSHLLIVRREEKTLSVSYCTFWRSG